ncbi:hypothetical protein ACFSC4_05370 [Deinococcus malanensis]|uniref:hypothetical protein n=1 Tax=Deinococcus malanensis TaxID=1706855 RepID=UPI0036403946
MQRFTSQGEYINRYAFRVDRTSEQLRQLAGLCVDGQGVVYIVDSVAHKVRKIEADGTPGLTLPLENLVGEATDVPWLLQVGPDGQLFAVRQGGQVLRTISTTGDLIRATDLYAPVQALSLLRRAVPAASRA